MVKKLFIQNIALVLFITLLQYLFYYSDSFTEWYSTCVLNPLQQLRNYLYSVIPFSVGEVLYLIIAIILLVSFFKIIKSIFQDRKNLLFQLLRTTKFISVIYLLFLMFWGGSYYRQSIVESIQNEISLDSIDWNKDKLLALNNFLIEKINENVINIDNTITLEDINTQAEKLYKENWQNRSSATPLKPSVLHTILSHIGVQGYYHPLTGEGHYNKNVHLSLQPFVFVHEMAHQMGVGSETDANFMAYVLCTQSKQKLFKYSAYLNVYFYTYNELYYSDSVIAKNTRKLLPATTLAHIEAIKELSKKFNSPIRKYTLAFYDHYLKAFGQEQGIGSYGKVGSHIYFWEFMQNNKNLKHYFID